MDKAALEAKLLESLKSPPIVMTNREWARLEREVQESIKARKKR
jgi:hypothetical protein